MSASAFLNAATRQQHDDRVPVWFMRQAGRSLPEYREVRAGTSMLESCHDPPALVCEITMQPVRRHDVDAAIFFSDIMVPLQPAGGWRSTSWPGAARSSPNRSATPRGGWTGCGR